MAAIEQGMGKCGIAHRVAWEDVKLPPGYDSDPVVVRIYAAVKTAAKQVAGGTAARYFKRHYEQARVDCVEHFARVGTDEEKELVPKVQLCAFSYCAVQRRNGADTRRVTN